MTTSHDALISTLPILHLGRNQGEAYWFDGSLRIIKSRASTHGITFIEAWIPEGFSPHYHVHRRESDVMMILEGQGTFRSGETLFDARSGDLVSLPPNVPHSFQVTNGPLRAVGLYSTDHFANLIVSLGVPARTLSLPPPDIDTTVRSADVARVMAEHAARGVPLDLDQEILGPSPFSPLPQKS